jgi:hypothetical protein
MEASTERAARAHLNQIPLASEPRSTISEPQTDALKFARTKSRSALAIGQQAVKSAAEQLECLGFADYAGTRIRKELPKDIRESADHDFDG